MCNGSFVGRSLIVLSLLACSARGQSTAPAAIAADVPTLQAQVRMLMRQVAVLQADNAALRQQVGGPAVPSAASASQPSGARAEAVEQIKRDIRVKTYAMHGVKTALDLLRQGEGPVDEQALNLLGAALDAAADNPQYAASRLFTEAAAAYQQYNAKLEATKPGMKRWGSAWMPAGEADAKLAARQQGLQRVSQQEQVVERARQQVNAANQRVAQQRMRRMGNQANSLDSATADANAAAQACNAAVQELNRIKAQVPEPDWGVAP